MLLRGRAATEARGVAGPADGAAGHPAGAFDAPLAATLAAPGGKPGRGRPKRKNQRSGYLFLLPWFLGMLFTLAALMGGILVAHSVQPQVVADSAAFHIVDGSGLSAQNLLSPQSIVQLLEHARTMFGQPYPVIHGRGNNGNNAELFGSRKADPRGIAALKRATDCVLPVPAVMSMIPGNVAPEAATLDVPVFLGIGERDMVGPPHQVPAAFTASRDISLYLLAETGHSHFLFPARTALFDRLSAWADAIL